MNKNLLRPKRALVSVSDKTGIETVCKKLHELGIEILSTGGTADYLTKHRIPWISVSTFTGKPEIFGGRIKTISTEIEGGLLFRRFHSGDLEEARNHNIRAIDIVICSLYPFEKVAAKSDDADELIENIDVGGPTMIRSAAKNCEAVAVITSTEQYSVLLDELDKNEGQISWNSRALWSVQAFERLSAYDQAIATKLKGVIAAPLGHTDSSNIKAPLPNVNIDITAAQSLRYGENPHQKGWISPISGFGDLSFATAKPIQGKELSYNNYLDMDAAWRAMSDVYSITQLPTVALIKHLTPCGLSSSNSLDQALEYAWYGEEKSSFGSVIAFSHTVDASQAKFLETKFIEVLIAPDYTSDALKILSTKKNLRLLKMQPRPANLAETTLRTISGALLIQDEDIGIETTFKEVTQTKFPEEKKPLIPFSIAATKHLKSNAISLVAKRGQHWFQVGCGMGQPNRLDSLELLAAPRAESNLARFEVGMSDLVLCSEAFFPFADSIEACHEAGIRSIVQPGGSIRDDEVIAACDKFGISMVLTGRRHFRH